MSHAVERLLGAPVPVKVVQLFFLTPKHQAIMMLVQHHGVDPPHNNVLSFPNACGFHFRGRKSEGLTLIAKPCLTLEGLFPS